MANDWSVYDAALELAEREHTSMSVGEMISIAEKVIDQRWIELAEREPEKVIELHKQMVGEVL